jgi:hypothetical protein
MAIGNVIRRLRGAVGNALVWGGAWFVSALAIFGVLRLTGVAQAASVESVVRMAAMFAVMGTIAGAVFSTFIGLRYQGRRLSEISWVRFGISGGIVTGLFVPSFIVLMRFLSGDPFLAVRFLLVNGAVGAVLGGVAAAATMKLAQMGDRLLPGRSQDQLEQP